MKEKIDRVSLYALDLDKLLRENVPKLKNVLTNTVVESICEIIDEIDAALTDKNLDTSAIAELNTARAEVLAGLRADIDKIRSQFRMASNTVEKKTTDLRNVILTERLSEQQEDVQRQKNQLEKDIVEQDKKKQEKIADRTIIIQSQNIIRERNLADIFKDFIPNASELEKLNLTKPEIAAIQLAVETYKKILGNISDGIKYSNLADARILLSNQITQILQEIATLNAKLASIEQQIMDLSNVVEIDVERAIALKESDNLFEALSIFLNKLTALFEQEVNTRDLSILLQEKKLYLEKLDRQYRLS
ncbi:alpha-xenorhabdolysin family binary toxin subunit B [Collimonas antrihumi]|uniref:alpha-xenorhabdolysin family binary toxin subunit B n=1 Tax=Collimonas antrihumi TaxID=1940615 RepID=UPI001B8D24E8